MSSLHHFLATQLVLGVHMPTKEASLSPADTQGLLPWVLLINEPFMGLMASGHVPAS